MTTDGENRREANKKDWIHFGNKRNVHYCNISIAIVSECITDNNARIVKTLLVSL